MQAIIEKLFFARLSLSDFNIHTISYFGLILLKDAAYAVIFLIIFWLAITAIFKLIDLIHQLRQKYIFLEVTPPLVTEIPSVSTSELFSLVSGLLNQRSLFDRLLFRRISCSFEIVSTKEKGIRYILQAPESIAQVIEKNLRSYIPGIKIQETSDYLPENIVLNRRITEYKLVKHFSLPINEQVDLQKHDPLAYLAGNMTQLKLGELMAMQVVIRPLGSNNRRNATKAKMVK